MYLMEYMRAYAERKFLLTTPMTKRFNTRLATGQPPTRKFGYPSRVPGDAPLSAGTSLARQKLEG